MKYKVGDKVRMADNLFDIKKDDVCTIKRIDDDLFYFLDKEEKVGMTKGIFSHLVISEITDELIDRFKKEKIAWHFKNKGDYSKMLYLLSNKGIGFHFAVESPEEFFDKKKDFCLNLYSLKLHLQYGGLDNHIKDGYEIIEIMNPVYVPFTDFTEEIEVNGIYKYDNCLKGNVKGKPMYKGIDCELLYQHYINIQCLGKKNIDLWNEIQRLTKENADLKKQIKQYQEKMKILLDDRTLYKSRLSVIKELCDED